MLPSAGLAEKLATGFHRNTFAIPRVALIRKSFDSRQWSTA